MADHSLGLLEIQNHLRFIGTLGIKLYYSMPISKGENDKIFWIRVSLLIVTCVVAYISSQFLIKSLLDKSLTPFVVNFLVVGVIVVSLAVTFFIVVSARKLSDKVARMNIELSESIKETQQEKAQLEDLSTVLASLHQVITVVNKDDRIEWVNASFQRFFGFELEETIGRKVSDLLAGEKTDHALIEKMDEAIFIKKEPITVKLIHYRKDRSTFWARVEITPILDEKGNLEKYISVSSDISDEQVFQSKLEKSEANFDQITSTIKAVTYLYNIAENHYEFISQNCKETLGVSAAYFYNGEAYTKKYVHPDDRAAVSNATIHVKQGTPYSIEYRIVIGDEIRWIHEESFPILDSANNATRNSGICTDITASKNNQNKLLSSQSDFKLISETIPDVYYLYNLEQSKFDFISTNCKAVFGVEAEQFYSGKTRDQLNWHEDDISLIKNAYSLISEGKSFDIEYRLHVDGELRWIRERSRPIKNESGIIIKKSGVCSDVTSIRESSDKLLSAHADAQKLAEIGVKINEEIDVKKVITRVHKSVLELMDADGFGIGVVNHEENKITFPLFFEKDTIFEDINYPLNDNLLCNICVNEKREIIIHDLEKDLAIYSEVNLEHTKGERSESIIYIPLLNDKLAVTGVITVQSFKRNCFSNYQLQLLRSISLYAANSVSKATIHHFLDQEIKLKTEEISQKNEELSSSLNDLNLLSQIGIEMAQSTNLEEIFEMLYGVVKKIFHSTMMGIRFYHKESETVEYKFGMDADVRDEPFTISMSQKDNISVWCIENNSEVLINDVENEIGKYVSSASATSGVMPKSIIMCPIVSEEGVMGVMTVQSHDKNNFSDRHLHLLRTLVSYAGPSIHNARILGSLEDKVQVRTEELSLKNKEINDSISYAQRIQQSTLTNVGSENELFPSSFVIYKPKDIVSGDFYRLDSIKSNENKKLKGFIVGDCTGHGVPGAILSILCSSLIRQTLSNHNVRNAGDALNNVRDHLQDLFNTYSKTDLIRDGMDAAFGVVDDATQMLYFAGANIDCFIVRENEIIRLKGNRQHVGYSPNPLPFETNSFQLKSGDNLYVSTDGFRDQFGGPISKKFGSKRFNETIIAATQLPLNEREKFIIELHDNWQGDEKQTDDICLLGIEIK